MKRWLLLVLLINTSCSSPNNNYTQEKESISSNTIVKLDKLNSLNKLESSNFIEVYPFQISGKEKKDWYKIKKTPEIIINDVLLTDLNKSILSEGKQPESSISSDYNGKDVFITIKGIFKSKNGFNLDNSLFTLEPPLIAQSFVGNDPKLRILLDDAIMLTPVSISETEIKAKINTKNIPDLYLIGSHKLSIYLGNYFTDTLISITEPEEKQIDLKPKISSIEILKDKKNNPINIKIQGKNFMLFPKFSYSTIDSEFGFGYQSEIESGENGDNWITIIHIPNPTLFKNKNSHLLIYSTPFGTTFKTFGNN